jgi:hypothetical protein
LTVSLNQKPFIRLIFKWRRLQTTMSEVSESEANMGT